jgi:secreted Zn-dependent insulinase-like peptidase
MHVAKPYSAPVTQSYACTTLCALCSHKPHFQFKAPKAVLSLRFILPGTSASLASHLYTALFAQLLSDDLNELAYEAELAGIVLSFLEDHSVHLMMATTL